MNELSINTSQNVKINFNTASVGDRILAQLLDSVVIIAYFAVIYFAIEMFNLDRFLSKLDGWSENAVFILLFSPAFLGTLVQESLWEGQTIGKRILKIRVIKIDGYQASFGDYLIRWMFSIVEISIASGMIAMLAVIFSKKNQRLGDMAAGTAVVSLKNNININHTILQELQSDYVPMYPLVIKLSDNDVRIVKETLETAIITRDYETITKLKEKVISVTGIKNSVQNDQDFLKTLLKDYNFYTQNM